MEALIELCDLIVQNPAQLADKLVWICGRCPQPELLLAESPKVSRSQLHAVLALARFISKCGNHSDERARSLVLAFYRSIRCSFNPSFWPQSFGQDSILTFYNDYMSYVCKATSLSGDFATDIAGLTGEIVSSAVNNVTGEGGIFRAFLKALALNFPPIIPSDANKLVSSLIDQLGILIPGLSNSAPSMSAGDSSSMSSLREVSLAGWKSNVDLISGPAGVTDGGSGAVSYMQAFDEESVESLEKKVVVLKLIGCILDKASIETKILEHVRVIATEQFQSMIAFLKTRKRDWSQQGQLLKAKINAKLSVSLATTTLLMNTLASFDLDGKSAKRLLHGALALLIESAEACLVSVWRKLRACEELFSSLLAGISQTAVARNGQLLRILLIRFKPLVLATCAQADTWGSSQGAMFDSVLKTCCGIVEFGWNKDRSPVDTFIIGLATSTRECNDYGHESQGGNEKQAASPIQLNVIRLLADLTVSVNKSEVVDMILPLFIESLEEGDASNPCLLRLRLLDAVSRMAALGFEKSYREAVVLMTRSYLSKLFSAGPDETTTPIPEATSERVETLPAGFLLIARGLTSGTVRLDYRQRLLSLCSDVGLAAESKSDRSGAEVLGPLLPAVAEMCSDFDPSLDVEPSLLKQFRNLWFYIALFGLVPPMQRSQGNTKSVSTSLDGGSSMATNGLEAVNGPSMFSAQWSSAVQGISHGTPPLVVSSVKWLEDELELNALQNPGTQKGVDNKKVAVSQRTALSAALGGRVEVFAMSTISGVKATYLLAVAFLERIRFSSNGGVLNGGSSSTASQSAFSCVFEYLKSPNLLPAVSQCLTAIVHQAFETSMAWLEDRLSETGLEADNREFALSLHACFLIRNLSQRDENVRNISVNLLTQLRDRFPQVLWNSASLDSLLFSVHNDPPSALVNDPAWVATIRALYQKIVREWIIISLSHAPCTTQGLLQEKLSKANTWKGAQPSTDVVSLLSEIRIGTGKNEYWTGTKTANIPAVMAAAAAASGGNLKLTEAFNLEVLSTGVVSATVKGNHAGEIAGMRRLYESIGGLDAKGISNGSDLGLDLPVPEIGVSSQTTPSFSDILITKFVRVLQKFVSASENGGEVDKSSFRESCSQATVLLLSNLGTDSKAHAASFSQLLRLLCWCPAYILTPDAMETGVFIWTWLVSAAPQLGSMVLSELVDAWLWTVDTKRGLFASEVRYSGPAAKLRPHLEPGEPDVSPEKNPVERIMAHRLWLGFFIDRFEVVRHDSVEQLLLIGRLVQGTTKLHHNFSQHPAATGTFFILMLLGLNFCACRSQRNLQTIRTGLQLLEDRVYRASLGWFSHEPQWNNMDNSNFAQSEAQCVSVFIQHLQTDQAEIAQLDSKGKITDIMKNQYHPIWGQMENYDVGKEKRKQLLLMFCQHEVDRLEVWAQPVNTKDNGSRPKISSEKWAEYAKTAFSVDPRIAFCLAARFPTNAILKTEVTQLVQTHILEIRNIPQALPYFVTPKAIDENSALLQQLPHWAACSITQALEFLTPAFKGHPRVMAYVLRVLESYPPERVTFFMPQLVQSLRYDDEKLVEGYLLRAAQRTDIFAHILIWHLQGETCVPESPEEAASAKNIAFQELLPAVRQRIIDGFHSTARDIFEREFDFFDKVTSISGVLFPLPKEERRAGIRRELEKIQVEGDDLYLPTAPSKLVRGIQVDSGIPLQSAAKVPIMITFNVVDRDGDLNDIKPQACIFKVGDDCRQDVLALQVISLLKDIYEAIGLKLYLYPYGVLPTGPERGIIEVVPNSRSRSQMGETNDGGLYEIFQQDFGHVGTPSFEAARENFIVSSAGYAVASLLLQPKDRHNGNLLFDNEGRLVHIDFGFILETSPGNNMRFESAHFKLSHEMTQLLDPSGVMKCETWTQFVSLCVKGYLAARRHMDGIISTVQLMLDSGLPCFSRGDPIGNLRKRFHPEMNEREAANFMIKICTDAYNKWTTAGYDLIQYLQQGIEK